MLGCTTVQCLAPKKRKARSDNYFLTGLSDLVPGRNRGRPRMTPVLQWADRVNADDIVRPVRFPSSPVTLFPQDFFINMTSRTTTGTKQCPSTPPVSISMRASHVFILIIPTSMDSWNGIAWMAYTMPSIISLGTMTFAQASAASLGTTSRTENTSPLTPFSSLV